jgi:hypothetical protein
MLGLAARKDRSAGERDAQMLMNVVMDEAQARLRERGRFAPFAACVDAGGQVELMAGAASSAERTAREIVEALEDALRERIRNHGLRSGAVASDVQFGKRNSGELREAVQLHIEHEDGYCVDIYVPYRLRKQRWGRGGGRLRVRWSHPVGQQGTPRFWSGG